jgi:hypothetical protein
MSDTLQGQIAKLSRQEKANVLLITDVVMCYNTIESQSANF